MPVFVTTRLIIPDDELVEAFARSSGPGGQHVNKVETQVELRWSLRRSRVVAEAERVWLQQKLASQLTLEGEVIVTSSLTRSQTRNREDARSKLAALLRAGLVRPKRRRPTRPSRGSVERRLTEKKQRGEKKRTRQGWD